MLKEIDKDGAVSKTGIAAFRLIPYISRNDPHLKTLARELHKVNYEDDEKEDSDSSNSDSDG